MRTESAVYPGTFDPLTKGHFDLIDRSYKIFDKLIIAVAGISQKPTGMFPIVDRLAMMRMALDDAGMKDVVVVPLD